MVSITKKEYERLLKESKTYNTYSASQKKYREANKQYYKDYHKKWQEENREKIREYQKAWRQQKKLVDSANNKGNISNDKGSKKKTNIANTSTRWCGYLYINGSKTYDAIISSPDKFAIMQYVMTMVDDNDDFKIVVRKVKE